MSSHKDYRAIERELVRQNWAITQTAEGHRKASPPNKAMPVVHFSESAEPRALRCES